jgi:hypothetical protein
MSTTNEEDSVQEVTTRNEEVNVAATETSMEEKDGETGNETTTTMTMKKEDDLEEDDGDECESRALNVLKQIDNTETEQAAHNSDATTCAACGLPQPSARILNNCPCRSVRYCNKKCQKKHRKKHAKECRRLIAEKKLKQKTTDIVTTPPVSTSDTRTASTATINNDDEGSQKEEEEEGSESTFSKKDVIVCSTCQTPQTESFVLKKCSCRAAQYCDKNCQKKHRKKHKKECRRLTAARKLKKNNNTKKKDKKIKQEEEQGERKEDVAIEPKKNEKEEEKGDECCICLEELPKDTTTFTRFSCCGQGMHDHCNEDLHSMNMGDNCPLCRALQPSTQEEVVKYLRPWVKKKKAWAQSQMGSNYYQGEGVKRSYEMAAALWKLAAQQGEVNAMYNVYFFLFFLLIVFFTCQIFFKILKHNI